jgi:hypothetical protein
LISTICRNVGAFAELLDISCHYGTPAFSSMQDGLYTTWSQAPSSFTAQDLISAAGNNPLVLGQHYYVSKDKCAAGSPALSPKWDFTSNAERGNAAAFLIGAKVGNLPAPTGSNNVDWVQLKNAEGELADTVYRVDTKGGQPPSSVSKAMHHGLTPPLKLLQCTAGDPPLTVRYTAKYCECSKDELLTLLTYCSYSGFFGGSVGP